MSRSRILITGGTGFVGRHLVTALSKSECDHHIIVASRECDRPTDVGTHHHVVLDVTNPDETRSVIAAEQPTVIVHLAAIAAIPAAQSDIRHTWDINFGGTFNIALAVRDVAPTCRLIHCSSAEVYGGSFRAGTPLDETALLDPMNAYGASKAAADILIGQMVKEGLKAIRFRPFNHTGPGQSEDFVVPAFAAQIARIERGDQEPVMHVGNLSSRRDVLDVRDVVDAYVRAVERFDTLPNGATMNIASGHAHTISDVLDALLSLTSTKISVVQDAGRLRKNDGSIIIGDASLARELLGWSPRHSLSETLLSVLEFQRGRYR